MTNKRVTKNNMIAKKENKALLDFFHTQENIDLVKKLICKPKNRMATHSELMLFGNVSKKSGLDPFTKQIYPIFFWNNRLKKEVMVIITGIDGYRSMAERSGTYLGGTDPIIKYRDDKKTIESATVTVFKLIDGVKAEITSTARWDEYYPQNESGQMFWKKMPTVMISKCAEALALRRAFPNVLSGIYIKEELDQADNDYKKSINKIVNEHKKYIAASEEKKSNPLNNRTQHKTNKSKQYFLDLIIARLNETYVKSGIKEDKKDFLISMSGCKCFKEMEEKSINELEELLSKIF